MSYANRKDFANSKSARLSRLSVTVHDAVLGVRFIAVVNGIIAAVINANFLITIHIDLEISTRAITRGSRYEQYRDRKW